MRVTSREGVATPDYNHRGTRMWREALLLLSAVAWLCPQAHGYFTDVDSHSEECFFDRVSSGMKMSLTFEVVDGGFLDIDVKVYFFDNV